MLGRASLVLGLVSLVFGLASLVLGLAPLVHGLASLPCQGTADFSAQLFTQRLPP